MFVTMTELAFSQSFTAQVVQASFLGGLDDDVMRTGSYDYSGTLFAFGGRTASTSFPLVNPIANQTRGVMEGFLFVYRMTGTSKQV